MSKSQLEPIFCAFLVVELNLDTYLGLNNFPTQNSLNKTVFPVITHVYSPDMLPTVQDSSNSTQTNPLEPIITATLLNISNPNQSQPSPNPPPSPTTSPISPPLTATQVLQKFPDYLARLIFPDADVVNSGFSSSFDSTIEYSFQFKHNGELFYGYTRRFLHMDQDISYPTVHCFLTTEYVPRFWSQVLEITHIRSTIAPSSLWAFLHTLGCSQPTQIALTNAPISQTAVGASVGLFLPLAGVLIPPKPILYIHLQ